MMNAYRSRCSVIAGSLLMLGCGSGSQSSAPPQTAASRTPLQLAPRPAYEYERALPDCPMQLPGTKLTSYPIEGGMALIFTTSSSPEELRRRARKFAQTLEQSPDDAAGVAARSELTELSDGARVDVRAADQRDVATLQQQIRRSAQQMRDTQSCPGAPQAT